MSELLLLDLQLVPVVGVVLDETTKRPNKRNTITKKKK